MLQRGASICVPLFVGASFFSSALRFQVLDAFRGVRKPRIHLQNARTLALLGTLAAFAVFVGTYVPLHGGLDFGSPRTRTKEGRSLTRLAAAATGAGGAPADDAGASQKSRLSKSLVERVEKNASKSTVGFTYRVALRDLSLARFDPREVQRVKAVGDGANAWRPEPGILWRAVSFTTYDALESTWNEESQYERKRWPSNGVLRLGRRNPGSTEPTVTLEHRFVTPVCRNIVHPYFLVAVATSDFFLYRRTPQDDLFPFPQPVRNARYRSKIAPLAPGLLVPKESASSGRTDPRCLEIPPAGEIGLDLRSFAETIFGAEAASLETRLVELREYFAKSFRYSKNALWRSNRNPSRDLPPPRASRELRLLRHIRRAPPAGRRRADAADRRLPRQGMGRGQGRGSYPESDGPRVDRGADRSGYLVPCGSDVVGADGRDDRASCRRSRSHERGPPGRGAQTGDGAAGNHAAEPSPVDRCGPGHARHDAARG
jgi:hypothetical protein